MTPHRTHHGLPRENGSGQHSRPGGVRLPLWKTHFALRSADDKLDPAKLAEHRRLLEAVCWANDARQLHAIRTAAAAFDAFLLRDQSRQITKRNGARAMRRMIVGASGH